MRSVRTIVLALGLALAAPLAFAQTEEEHKAHHPEGNAAPPAATEEGMQGDKGMDMDMMKSMQKNMKSMHELMEKVHAATDPAEKQRLLKEHMKAMRAQMKEMGGMGGGMMKGMMGKGGMGEGGKMSGDGTQADKMPGDKMQGEGKKKMGMQCGGKDGGKSGDMMMKCHRMMQTRMDMMQDMMGQILEHEEAEQELEHGK